MKSGPARRDITNQTFGNLTTIAVNHRTVKGKRYRTFWKCKCKCGKEKITVQENLTMGKVKDCGCACLEKYGRPLGDRTHGMSYTPIFRVWATMIARCHSPNSTGYFKYGARGISVCDRWRVSFENFYADMGNRPSDEHSIDRIDNNGNYCPKNCRWASRSEQQSNKRSSVLVFGGETLKQCASRLGLNYKSLHYQNRMRMLPIEEAIKKATPI